MVGALKSGQVENAILPSVIVRSLAAWSTIRSTGWIGDLAAPILQLSGKLTSGGVYRLAIHYQFGGVTA